MIPFLADDLHRILKQLMGRFLKKEVVKDSSIPNLIELDIKDVELHLKIGKVDPGFTADTMLRHFVNNGSVTKESGTKFREETKAMLIDIIDKVLKKSPLKASLVRNLTCLDPRKMATEPDSCSSKFKSVLVRLANLKRVNVKDCDNILDEFKRYLNEDVVSDKSRFLEFHPDREDRIDTFLQSTMKRYSKLWKVVSSLLLLSHGQATVERGFSVNREIEVVNLQEKTFQSLRLIVDHVRKFGEIKDVPLPKELLRSCASSRMRYQDYLSQEKKMIEIDESKNKRKRLLDEVEQLNAKKRCLILEIEDLTTSADSLAKKAEEEKNFFLLTRSNAFRNTCSSKKNSLN